MSRRKKQRSAVPPMPAPEPPKPLWYKRMWLLGVAVAGVVFTAGLNGPSLLQNIRKLPAEAEMTRDQYLSWLREDADWTGNWAAFPEGIVNTGDLRLTEGVDMRLSLQAKKGELEGIIASEEVCANDPALDFLLLRGSVSGDTASVEVWDIVGGHEQVYERLTLARKDNVVTVQSERGAESWFHHGAKIGKHPETVEGFMDNFCNRQSNASVTPNVGLHPDVRYLNFRDREKGTDIFSGHASGFHP